MLILDFYYLANTLININDKLKVDLCYLASTLTITNNKADNFIKKRLVISNQLSILCHSVMLEDDNFIPQ